MAASRTHTQSSAMSSLTRDQPKRSFAGPFYFLSFCDSYDWALYSVGTVAALICGVPFSGLDLLYGWWSNRLLMHDGHQPGPEEIRHASVVASALLTPIIVMDVVLVTLFFLCYNTAAGRVARRMRRAYLAAIVCQDAYYFEEIGAGEVASRLGRDLGSLETAIGEKLSLVVWSIGSLISGVAVSLAVAPKVGGTLVALLPFAIILFYLSTLFSNKVSAKMAKSEAAASNFLSQILASARVVKIHEAERQLVSIYDDHLADIEKKSKGKSASRGFTLSTTYVTLWLNYVLAFYVGGKQVADGLKPGYMLNSFFSMFSAIFSVIQLLPQINDIIDAVAAQKRIRAEILRSSPIDVRKEEGIRDLRKVHPDSSESSVSKAALSNGIEINLRNVTFAYRARPSIPVLNGLSAIFEEGKVTAIVGGSGSGKSTLSALLIRHYDLPDTDNTSEILFNGHPIKTIQLRALRSAVATVSQDCEIFSGTIFDNIAIGLTGTQYELFHDSSEELRNIVKAKVEDALRKAEAHEFISSLPEGIHTKVSGAKTTVLSGGQRQRLALARAFIRQPQILILDESTSALDSQTEKKIQANLAKEQAERGLTMIIIAHRLSTCRDADKIIVMEYGKKTEEGSHDHLLEKKGKYWQLIQHFKSAIGEETEEQAEVEDNTETINSLPRLLQREQRSEPTLHKEKEDVGVFPLPSTRQTSVNYLPHFVSRDIESVSIAGQRTNHEHPRRASRFLKYVLAQKRWTLLGLLAAITVGSSFPISAWLTGGAVNALSLPASALIRSNTARYASYFLILAGSNLLASLVEGFCLEAGAQRLIHKLRWDGLHAVLRQEVSWFEQEANASGSLASQVADHPTAVASALGLVLGQLTHSTCNLLGAAILSLVLSWRIALVGFSTLTLLILFGWSELHFLERYSAANSKTINAATAIATEHVEHIKSVSAFGMEENLLRLYDAKQFEGSRDRTRLMFFAATAFGFAQSTIFVLTALVIRYGGGVELADGNVDVETLYAVFEGVTIAAFSASRFFSFIGHLARARASFRAMCAWIERRPPLDAYRPKHKDNGQNDIVELKEGVAEMAEVEFKNVDLVYPSRPGMKALSDFSIHIKAGEHVALCGPSGGGKSSFLATLSKFYDPTKGTITVNGKNLQKTPDRQHFSKLAYVGQDSVLYEGTIRFNLTLGLQRKVTDAELHAVIRDCALSDFVSTLSLGIDTSIGMSGAQLSGGQKQRICIGRALLRHADLLLLDESTSALDIESEKLVQVALQKASAGRTTVSIAHRLSSIQGADEIYVIEDGKIVESGSHRDLLQKRARYFDLIEAQL